MFCAQLYIFRASLNFSFTCQFTLFHFTLLTLFVLRIFFFIVYLYVVYAIYSIREKRY